MRRPLDERMAFVPEGQADSSQARSAWGLEFGHFQRFKPLQKPQLISGFKPLQIGQLRCS
jgi:hypothetical protein